MEKGKLDKNINIEENSFQPTTKVVGLKNIVRLPSEDNCILIMWENNFQKIRIDMTPYLWDMLKSLGDENTLKFTHEKNDGWTLTINIDMERQPNRYANNPHD